MVQTVKDDLNIFTQTFRISKTTNISTLKKVACDFWGLNDKYYKFYDEMFKPINDDLNQAITVDKHFEAFGAKGSSGNQRRTAMFYLGKAGKDEDL